MQAASIFYSQTLLLCQTSPGGMVGDIYLLYIYCLGFLAGGRGLKEKLPRISLCVQDRFVID